MAKLTKDKQAPFTEPLTPDEQNLVRMRAYDIWKARKDDSKSLAKDDWNEAIAQLRAEQTFSGTLRNWGNRAWRWMGLKDKTPWDIAQVLFVPLALAVAGVALQEFAKQRDVVQQEVTRQREQQLADDKARQETLVEYLEEMSDLLKDGLLKSSPGSELIIIAQTKTIIALQSLDDTRQHLIIQFLAASNLNALNQYGLLHRSRMSQANFRGADLSGAVLIGADLSQADFSCPPDKTKKVNGWGELFCSNIRNANLNSADLTRADLTSANLDSATLSSANLSSAKLTSAYLNSANLTSTNLTSTNLASAKLESAKLESANLTSAYLSSANLASANLANANLANAYLSEANLSGANLSKANLSEVNLSEANLSDVNLDSAILLRTDLRTSQNLERNLLTSLKPPLLCHTKLPTGMERIVDPDRDCSRLPEELLKRYPEEFKTLEEAKQVVEHSGWGNDE